MQKMVKPVGQAELGQSQMNDHDTKRCPAWTNKETQQPSDCGKVIHA